MPAAAPRARRTGLLVVSALVWGAVALVLALHWDQSHEIWKTMTRVPRFSLAGAFLLVLGQWCFQSLRLWAILPRGIALSPVRTAHAFAVGEWVNLFIPARGGDALKIVLLERPRGPTSLTLPQATGAVLADKIVDGGTLAVLCAAAGFSAFPSGTAAMKPYASAFMLGVAAGVAVLVAIVFVWPRCVGRVARWRNELLQGLSALADSSKTLASMSFSLGAWIAEVLAIRVLCGALAYPLSLAPIVLALLTLNLGISVPVSVANLGVYEALLTFGLSRSGVPLPAAVAIATLHHALELIVTNVGAAGLSLWLAHASDRQIRGRS